MNGSSTRTACGSCWFNVARRNAVSSTPIAVGASVRAGLSIIDSQQVVMIRMIVAQPTPSADATRDIQNRQPLCPTCGSSTIRVILVVITDRPATLVGALRR
jgi:hypothetical protein